MAPLAASDAPPAVAATAEEAPAAPACEPDGDDGCQAKATTRQRESSARPQPLEAPDWWNEPGMGGNPMSRFGFGHCHEFDDGSMFCH